MNSSLNNNSYGIYLYYSNHGNIEDNEILDNDYGVYLHDFASMNRIEKTSLNTTNTEFILNIVKMTKKLSNKPTST